MKAFKALLGAQLSNAYGFSRLGASNTDVKDRSKARRKMILAAVLILYLACYFAFYIFFIGAALVSQGKGSALAALAVSISAILVLVFSTLRAPGYIFGCKDFDMLMSMPFSPRQIFLSKFMMLYIEMLAYSLMFSLPCAVCCGIYLHPPILFYFSFVSLVLFIPALSIAVGTLIAYIFTRLFSNSRAKEALTLIANLAFVLLIMLFSFKMSSVMGDSDKLASSVSSVLSVAYLHPFAKMFELGTLGGSFLNWLGFLLANAAIILLLAFVLGRAFLRLNGLMTQQKRSSTAFSGSREKRRGVLSALYRKELRYYFSQSMYVLNTAIGMVLLLMGAVALIIKGKDFASVFGSEYMPEGALFCIAIAAVMFMAGMTFTTASTISLEGQSLWILQTIPVRTDDIFLAKILLNFTVAIPPELVAIPIICVTLHFTLPQSLLLLLSSLIVTLFVSVAGLAINLVDAKFDWVNPIVVVKQSSATIYTMLCTMIPTMGLFFLSMLSPKTGILLVLVLDAVYLAVAALLILWLRRSGDRRFRMLSEVH